MTEQEEKAWFNEMEAVIELRHLLSAKSKTTYPDGVEIQLLISDKHVFSHQTLINARQRGNMLYLRAIYIKKPFRKLKLGSKMIAKLLKDCKDYGIKRVETEPISTSVDFFKKLGFEWIEGSNERMYLNL